MAAPDLTQRMCCFVQKTGTDDPSFNAVGSPYSRLTIAAALADLAANYIEPASATNYHLVAVGPGVFVEAAIALPPWTFIVGTCDGENNQNTEIQLTGNLTLSGAWSANSTQRGGVGDVRIRASSGTPIIDFTMPAPASGNPSRTIETWNTRHNLTQELFEATSTGDVRRRTNTIQDGTNTDLISDTSGVSQTHGFNLAAASVLVTDKTSFAMAASFQGIVSTNAAATFTVRSVAATGCTMRLVLSSLRNLVLTQTAPGVLAFSSDVPSTPIRSLVTFTGTATLAANFTYLNDAQVVGYTPAVAGNWSPVPVNVQQALDELAAGMGPGGSNGYAAATNNAGNTTATPTARNWFLALNVTGSARTSVIILDIAGAAAPQAGDRIFVGCTLPATQGIVLQFRNATAGGTLLYSFTTDAVNLSAIFSFVYTGSAWTFAGFQIPYQAIGGGVISSTVLFAAGVNPATGVSTNITSISLPAGTWNVYGSIRLSFTLPATYMEGTVTLNSATINKDDAGYIGLSVAITNLSNTALANPPQRLVLGATTTVYLVVGCGFAAGVATAWGSLWASRAP